MVKKILGITLAIVMLLFSIVALMGCWTIHECPMTMDTHIELVSGWVQENHIDSGEFESFEIYPIFLPNDYFSNFLLIEFAPLGFMFYWIDYIEHISGSQFFGGTIWREAWHRPGEITANKNSVFYGIEGETRYFFIVERNFVASVHNFDLIPAIRREKGFENLISNNIFNENQLENQAIIVLRIGNYYTERQNTQ